jgi:hypothetical protein
LCSFPFTRSAGKNAKISAIMTLAFTGLCLLNVIFTMAAQKPYDAINQAAEEPNPTFAIVGLVFLLITVGGCVIAPNAIAHQSLNGKKECCIMPWFGCFLLIAIVVSFPIVGSIVRAGQPYKSYCAVGTDTCTNQFKFQDTCNHTTENPMGRPGATAYVKVSKKYCDSKGMDYPGAWYEQIVSHIMTALLFVLSNAVTFYICWYKKNEFNPTAGTVQPQTTVVTAQIVSMTPPAALVQATIVKD